MSSNHTYESSDRAWFPSLSCVTRGFPPGAAPRHFLSNTQQESMHEEMLDEPLELWLLQRRSRRRLPRYWKAVLDAEDPWPAMLDARVETLRRRRKKVNELEQRFKKLAMSAENLAQAGADDDRVALTQKHAASGRR